MKKVLFVEDDVLIARIYSKKLQEAGYEVIVAADGLEAMRQLAQQPPDLVLLDLMVPKLDGLDVLRLIREKPELQSMRVVVLSNFYLTTVADRAAEIGVEAMLSKTSCDPGLLTDTLRKVFEQPAPDYSARKAAGRARATGPAAPQSEEIKSGSGTPESPASFRTRMRRDFFEQISAIARSVEEATADFLSAEGLGRNVRLEALSRKIRFVSHMTSMAGCYRIAQLSSALEALVFELQERPAAINPSTLHTVSTIGALLVEWLRQAEEPDEQCLAPTTVLVVDDDEVSNRALAFALSRASITARTVTDPVRALELLRAGLYEAVVMDINLPGMNGFVVCEQMRELPLHRQTPVIFLTSHAEFEERARSLLNPDDDFIIKPILPIELTVKITAHVLRRRYAAQNSGAPHPA